MLQTERKEGQVWRFPGAHYGVLLLACLGNGESGRCAFPPMRRVV